MADELTIAGLFEGYGGLTSAVRSVLGGELIWYSEIDPAANKVLAHHHPNVPNVGDVATVEWLTLPRPTVLSLGFPCQDISSAGLRRGMSPDTRSGLWAHGATAISILRPELVVIENVRGICSSKAHCDLESCPWCMGDGGGGTMRALGAVLGDLADLGYDARWCGLRASDVGAPHSRYRIFIVAGPATNTNGFRSAWTGRSRDWWCGDPHHHDWGDHATAIHRCGRRSGDESRTTAPDSGCLRIESGWTAGSGEAPRGWSCGSPSGCCDDTPAADSDCEYIRQQPVRIPERDSEEITGSACQEWGPYGPAIRRWGRILGRPAPAPTVQGRRGGPQLSPVFVEWMMGLPAGYVTDVSELTRNDMLKMLGNGVVPMQGATALRYLLSR